MNRSSFLASSASIAAVGGVPGGTHFVERKADFDEAAFAQVVGRPADVRQLWEAVSFHPQIFSNVKNSLNGLQFGYGYAPSRIAMVVAPHSASSAYTYTDYLYKKYNLAEALTLKDAKGNPVTSNLYLAPAAPLSAGDNPDAEGSMWQDTSIQTLQRRGVVFLTCHTAVEEQARNIVKGGYAPSGMSASDVADDILTHLIPGTHVVPSMVATVAVLQSRYRYAYTTLTF